MVRCNPSAQWYVFQQWQIYCGSKLAGQEGTAFVGRSSFYAGEEMIYESLNVFELVHDAELG